MSEFLPQILAAFITKSAAGVAKTTMRQLLLFAAAALSVVVGHLPAATLEEMWENPPREARLRAYWWWLNGNVTKEAITNDLEQMKAKGFGGAVLFDADGSSQDKNARVPAGPAFFSPQWRELFKHALREASRLGLEMSLNIQSGWNLGGPVVKVEDSAKKLVWSETNVKGSIAFAQVLPQPQDSQTWYRDLFVVALKVKPNPRPRPPIKNLAEKALIKGIGYSTPDTSFLLSDVPATAGDEDARPGEVLDLTSRLGADGLLRWNVPAGEWRILRFGCTVGDRARVSTSGDGWKGYALDVYDAGAFRRYWDAVVEPLIADAGPLAGETLKYLHTDSWEIGAVNWTPTLREEFRKRRGYDLLPWLPVMAGRIIESRDASNRFLFDLRKTLGDLAVDNHYKPFAEWAHGHKLEIHPESGGPHSSSFDAQRCLGINDAPMSEFWAWSPRHRVGDPARFFVKQPASAAHTNGQRLVLAEGFTTIGLYWQETLWDNLKPAFDKACTEGLNRLFWHVFVCSPKETGVPGQQYFAGTYLNPKVTWWSRSAPFFTYLNRCQMLLQRGLPVADALYYYGDNVPNFTQLRDSDPAKLGAGFDYDVIAEETLLTRVSARDGRLVRPDGMSYRVLVLPEHSAISLPVLRKVREWVAAGARVVGVLPSEASGLTDFATRDAEVKRLAAELWSDAKPQKVIVGKTAREVLLADGVLPDFEFEGGGKGADISYIHRRDGETEIYFVASRGERPESLRCTFRVSGKAPEIWNAVTGERRVAAAYEEKGGRVVLPLDFAPCGSWFVIFREPAAKHPADGATNSPSLAELHTLGGKWSVAFDEKWGGPAKATFDSLVSWPTRAEPGIQFYSGTATYQQKFDLPQPKDPTASIHLDLGRVREIAEVRLNGQSLGILWAPPFRVDISRVVKQTGNELEIDVVNFWPNRVIGDAMLPPAQRLTQTNIRKLTAKTPLVESGLLGPVRILERHR